MEKYFCRFFRVQLTDYAFIVMVLIVDASQEEHCVTPLPTLQNMIPQIGIH